MKRYANIEISVEEWITARKYISGYYQKTRYKFLSFFTNFLSQKLQDNGINCWLVCKWNWFRLEDSQKQNANYWSGSYKCIDKNCSNSFHARIEKLNCSYECDSSVNICTIKVRITGSHLHSKRIKKKVRCSKTDRCNTALKLKAHGITKVRQENLINNIFASKQTGKYNLGNEKYHTSLTYLIVNCLNIPQNLY